MYIEIQFPFILFYIYQTLEGPPSVQLLFEEISVLKGIFMSRMYYIQTAIIFSITIPKSYTIVC